MITFNFCCQGLIFHEGLLNCYLALGQSTPVINHVETKDDKQLYGHGILYIERFSKAASSTDTLLKTCLEIAIFAYSVYA